MAKQTEQMRILYQQYKGEESRIIKEYAKSEELGIVVRKSNLNGVSPKEYARALFKDGVNKGWINERSKLTDNFENLREECMLLVRRFNVCTNLYARQAMLRRVADMFFYDVYVLTHQDYILQVCRLTDSAESRSTSNTRENISIQLINKQLKENKQFNEEINKISEEILEYCKKLRQFRNESIAHNNQKTYSSDVRVWGGTEEFQNFFQNTKSRDFYQNIQEYCDAVGNAIGIGPLAFSGSGGTGDEEYLFELLWRAESLIPFLEDMLKNEDYKEYLRSIKHVEKHSEGYDMERSSDYDVEMDAVGAIERYVDHFK